MTCSESLRASLWLMLNYSTVTQIATIAAALAVIYAHRPAQPQGPASEAEPTLKGGTE